LVNNPWLHNGCRFLLHIPEEKEEDHIANPLKEGLMAKKVEAKAAAKAPAAKKTTKKPAKAAAKKK